MADTKAALTDLLAKLNPEDVDQVLEAHGLATRPAAHQNNNNKEPDDIKSMSKNLKPSEVSELVSAHEAEINRAKDQNNNN